MSVIISLLIVNLNSNSSSGAQTTFNSYNSTRARLIANSGIEIYLEKLRRNKSLKGEYSNNSLMNGSYDINIYGNDSLLTIRSTATFDDAEHTSVATATRDKIGLPNINSSVYVSSNNLSLNLNGNMDISGNDHDINGASVPGTPLPGIAVDDPSDSAYIINNLKSKLTSAISGEGGAPSVSVADDSTDWLSLAESYIFAADITLPTGTYSTGTILGTASEPKITYVSGDVDLAGTAYGYGIMVVNGDISLSGNFTYHGIVIAYGNSTITTKTTGNSGIFGASIFVGQSVDMQATGNAKLYYSSEAINNAKVNLKSSRFKILSWWE
ncbi:MAG TPA: hypothetical protein VKA26_09385 [Ignavibacteriaceae bacterium]|nr:hypothetical protein [Ignavibacteriaceae bacterium]